VQQGRGDYRQEVTALLLDAICSKNGGRMPATMLEWRTVAKRFGVRKIRIRSQSTVGEPFLRADVIWLPRVRHRYCLALRHLSHEAAEAGLIWEGEAPYNYPAGWEDDCHRIARLIEKIAVASLEA
jgi:hypothetical protein